MDTVFYSDIVADAIARLTGVGGSGGVLRALGLGHSLAPEGVTDYTNQLAISEFANVLRSKKPSDARSSALSTLEAAERFLITLREERLRQAAWSFNAALILVLLGTAIVLAGAILLYRGAVTSGAVTAAVGAISNITSVLVFKLNRDTNDRLDAIARAVGAITAQRQVLESLPEEASSER